MAAPTIVTLPDYPAPTGCTFKLNSFASDLTPPLGGQTQRVLRLGSRFSLDLEYPAMPYVIGQQWLSRLLYAEGYPVAVQFPQRGAVLTSVGAVEVNGAAASPLNSGGQLAVRGGLPGSTILAGRFFHIASQVTGRRYVHQLIADVTLDGSGAGTFGIVPFLRFAPQDGDAIELVKPMLEGFLTGSTTSWTLELVRRIGLKFTVMEDR